MSPRAEPVLLGGLFIGVLSALPIVSAANCCCLWIIGGGGLTAYLLQQTRPEPIQLGDGALAGFLAGLLGAVIYAIIAAPARIIMAPLEREMAQRVLDTAADVPPEIREMVENMGQGGPLAVVFGFFVMLCAGMAFSTLGGLLGAIFFKRAAPPPPPDLPVGPLSVPPSTPPAPYDVPPAPPSPRA